MPGDDTRKLDTDPAPPFPEDDEERTGPHHAMPGFLGDSSPALPPGVEPSDWREAILRKVVRMGAKLRTLQTELTEALEEFEELEREVSALPAGGQ